MNHFILKPINLFGIKPLFYSFFLFFSLTQNILESQVLISSSQTWNNLTTVNTNFPTWYNGIQINSGVTLVIDGITLTMDDGAFFDVFQGGHLELINGATIIATGGDIWQGIYLTGDNTIEQYNPSSVGGGFPDPSIKNNTAAFDGVLNPNQTSIILNNSTLENANFGIHSVDGAVVRVKNGSIIKNFNTHGIRIDEYLSTTHPEVNASYLMNSNIYIDNQTSGTNTTEMIYLSGVNGVNIGGNLIGNFSSALVCSRGTGIYGINSSLTISNGGDQFCSETGGLECEVTNCNSSGPNPSTSYFQQLSVGIMIDQTGENFPSLGVSYSSFSNNMKGIEISKGMNSRIYHNSFTSDCFINSNLYYNGFSGISCHYDQSVIDILLKNNTRSTKIYDNNFNSNLKSNKVNNSDYCRGITHIVSQGTDKFPTLFKNNIFNNYNTGNIATDNVFGIEIEGDQSGTLITCNSFDNMGIDINLNLFGTGVVYNVQSNDKNTNLSAYNKFSNSLAGRYRIDNRGNSFFTYYYNGLASMSNSYYPGSNGYSPNTLMVIDVAKTEPETQDCNLTCEQFLTDLLDVNTLSNRVTIYPQPAFDFINFSANRNIIKYSIYDMQGGLIIEKLIEESQIVNIEVSNFIDGCYFIVLNDSKNGITTSKFIVNH